MNILKSTKLYTLKDNFYGKQPLSEFLKRICNLNLTTRKYYSNTNEKCFIFLKERKCSSKILMSQMWECSRLKDNEQA